MNEIDTFEFDRQGYIVIPGLLTEAEVTSLAAAVDELEEHALAHVSEPPRKDSGWGANYHASSERGYHTNGERAEGKTLIVEDYWNANPAFDVLLDHAPTMDYVHGIELIEMSARCVSSVSESLNHRLRHVPDEYRIRLNVED